jgi:hypothetical protein
MKEYKTMSSINIDFAIYVFLKGKGQIEQPNAMVYSIKHVQTNLLI